VKLTWVGSLLVTVALSAVTVAQDLGPHNINGQGCLSCHNSTVVDPSNVMSSFNFGAFPEQDPTSHSAVCLSCHDGSFASSGSALNHSHPVNTPYLLGTDGHWPGTVTQNGVKFFASNFDMVYGRPIRFYVASGTPYVECSSCHDPHNHSVAVVTINGQTFTRPSKKFLRGWYDEMPGSNSASQFCRSCHYEQSNEYVGNLVATM
jgi:hypothetical protein